jgi:predicted RNA-binding protein associated with RNAse of E/G family
MTVRKLNAQGKTLLCWPASLLQHTPEFLQVEARFSHSDRLQLAYALFERGDRFVEWFFTARWYSIYQVFGGANNCLKGWYCNVTRPAQVVSGEIHTVDLALDLWVAPDGTQKVLDEDEFAALQLIPGEQAQARSALAELQAMALSGTAQFAALRAAPANVVSNQ